MAENTLSFATLAGGGVEEKLQYALSEVAANIADPNTDAKKAGELPNFALFEADGGAWRIEAMKRIKAYLEGQLAGLENVVVLG
jgi:hypothetical protein